MTDAAAEHDRRASRPRRAGEVARARMAPIVPAQNIAGRALMLGHRHHDLPVLPDARRGDAGARHGRRSGRTRSRARRRSRSSPTTGSTWKRRWPRPRRSRAAFPASIGTRIVDREATARLLEPWLGAGPRSSTNCRCRAWSSSRIDESNPPDFAAHARRARRPKCRRPSSTITAPGSTGWSPWRAPP